MKGYLTKFKVVEYSQEIKTKDGIYIQERIGRREIRQFLTGRFLKLHFGHVF